MMNSYQISNKNKTGSAITIYIHVSPNRELSIVYREETIDGSVNIVKYQSGCLDALIWMLRRCKI